jgi:D-sedoheptulose 7-phosphate isomerase
MPFPHHGYDQADGFLVGYRDALFEAWHSLDGQAVSKAATILDAAIRGRHTIFACGNGGSAAISNHLLCDFLKGIQTDTELRPRVVSLAAHLELITAIANDISYDYVFVYQQRSRMTSAMMTYSYINYGPWPTQAMCC